MILSTVPGTMVLGCSGIRAGSRFSSIILADLAMRGFAISFRTLARVASPDSFLPFLWSIHLTWHLDGSHTVPFCTVAKQAIPKAEQMHASYTGMAGGSAVREGKGYFFFAGMDCGRGRRRWE
jgi:hypothetical protein